MNQGDRVRINHLAVTPGGYDDNVHFPTGVEGTIVEIDDFGRPLVVFDQGGRLFLLEQDDYEVTSQPQPSSAE